MVHRLQKLMNKIISANQSAFVKGRLILDNILVAHECMHYLKNKRTGSTCEMALKLDMSKAYDRIEWRFLWFMMGKLGFDKKWIEWVQECVATVSYSVVVEGQPFGYFKPNRGLRQGDPLSPYLFLICAEGFSFLFHTAEQNNQIHGIKVGSRCPSISHLLFADDSLLFSRASPNFCANILNVLNSYEAYSGQMINLNKSAIFFSCNTPQRLRTRLAQQMKISHVGARTGIWVFPPQFKDQRKLHLPM